MNSYRVIRDEIASFNPLMKSGIIIAILFSSFASLSLLVFIAPSSVSLANSDNIAQTSSVGNSKTRPGALYVLDSNNLTSQSQVLVVDPVSGSVINSFKSYNSPDFALSPDGSTLYISSMRWGPDGREGEGLLEVIDTATSRALITVNNPDQWMSTSPHYPSHMTVSNNGRWLHIFKSHQTRTEYSNYIATFDTRNYQFLSETASVSRCVSGLMVPGKGKKLYVFCSESDDVRILDLKKNGGSAASSKVNLRIWSGGKHGQRPGLGFISDNRQDLNIVMGDGRFFKVSEDSKTITQTDLIDSINRRKMNKLSASVGNGASEDWMAGKWIRYQTPASSPGSARLYIGVGKLADLNQGQQMFDEIVVLDKQTLNRINTIKTSRRFYNLAISRDGLSLYAVDPSSASIMVIDTSTNREVQIIENIGTSPIQVIPAP